MREIVFVETNASGHGVRAIATAQQLGLSVRFLTSQRAFYRSSGVDQLASVDRIVEVDTGDVDEMVQAVDPAVTAGVITFLDYPLLAAATLASRLGLPHQPIDGLRACRFKDLTRARLGEPRPRYTVLTENDRPKDSPVGYPAVVKPVDDSGSVGVEICRDRGELQRALAGLRARHFNARNYRLARRWLVEEYVEGPEFSAELLHADGAWRLLGITRKLLAPPPFFVEVGHVFPAGLPEAQVRLVERVVNSWLTRLGLVAGAAHVEFRLTDTGPVLMEVNPRLGGDLIPELIRIVLGFDVVEYLLRWATGLELPALANVVPDGAAAIAFLTSPVERGILSGIGGAEALNRLSFVEEAALPRLGTPCGGTRSSYDRLGYIVVRGLDPEDAETNARRAVETIKLTYRDER